MKTLIWIQSVIGAALLLGMLWAVFLIRDFSYVLGISLVGAAWCLALRALGNKAERVGANRTESGQSLPALLGILWAIAEVLSLGVDLSGSLGYEMFRWNLVAHLFLGLILVLRGGISRHMKMPFHRGTWRLLLGFAVFGFSTRLGVIVLLLLTWRGC